MAGFGAHVSDFPAEVGAHTEQQTLQQAQPTDQPLATICSCHLGDDESDRISLPIGRVAAGFVSALELVGRSAGPDDEDQHVEGHEHGQLAAAGTRGETHGGDETCETGEQA
jgi:hypothetical protein